MMNNRPAASTTREVATAIERLREALRDEYGVDFAYTVSGHGHILAASTMQLGCIQPVIRCRGCGRPINATQAGLSSARHDGALPACQDCVTNELTRRINQ